MSLQAGTRKLWFLGLLLIVILTAAFYFVLIRGVKTVTTKQVLRQEQTLARAEASNIASFFEIFGESVVLRARLRSMERMDATTLQDLDAFMEQWRDSGLVGGVALTDKNGVVKFNSNLLGTQDVGESLSDRDYFVWAKSQPDEGQHFVGQAVVSRLGASKGQIIVPVASPVFQNGKFSGVVVAVVELDPLIKRYLDQMKVTDSTEAYLIGAKGDLLYNGTVPATVGSSAFTSPDRPFLSNRDLTDKLEKALNDRQEGSFQSGGYLIAYSPIKLVNKSWLVVMSSPIENVTNATRPIYIRQLSILVLIFLSTLLFEYIVIREAQKNLFK